MFDSHVHLTAAAFASDINEVLSRGRAAGVHGFVSVASDVPDAEAALRLAGSHPDVWSTVGLHPHEASRFGPGTLPALEALAAEADVVAVGEAGLDYHYDHSPRAAQLEAFEAQLDLAARLGLPIVVHSREADSDMAEMLRRWGPRVRGVLHCFTGGAELLTTGLDVGWYVSFGGMLTFRSFDAASRVAAVPRDRLLLETDAPYLAPVPHRGKRNEPAFLPHARDRLAELWSDDPGAAGRRTEAAARAFYRLPAGPDQ